MVVVGDFVRVRTVLVLLAACVCAQTPLVLVSFHVQGEVIRPGEGARADGALEGLGARVLPVVASELVGASEAPVAALPRAPVWLLTWRGKEKGNVGE